MTEKIVMTNSGEATAAIFGAFDMNVRMIERAFDVRISNRNKETEDGDAIVITGEAKNADKAAKALEYLKHMAGAGEVVSEQSVEYVIGIVRDDLHEEIDYSDGVICITNRGKPIKPKTAGQKKYVKAIRDNTVVLGLGPAGTGKTFLAVAMATEALRNKQVSRIILTRPAVEAGERLGFLPGDLQSKIDPYLRPLYDALFETLGPENYQRHLERGTIEIAPLAYMRGRTLDRACVILDEAQNTNLGQLKMFLTRMGCDAKFIVTGDASQIDLPNKRDSGLLRGIELTKDIKGVKTIFFRNEDIVRHPLVAKIVKAFEKGETV